MQAWVLLQEVLDGPRELLALADAALVGAFARHGGDRERRRVALVRDLARQLGDVGHTGRDAGLVLAGGERGRVEHEQRRGADHGERRAAGLDRAVGRVVGRDLGVPWLDDDLATGDATRLVLGVGPRLDRVDRALEQTGSERRAHVGHGEQVDLRRRDADLGRLQRFALARVGGGRRRGVATGDGGRCGGARRSRGGRRRVGSGRHGRRTRTVVVTAATGGSGDGQQQSGGERRRARSNTTVHWFPPCTDAPPSTPRTRSP